MKRRGKNYIFFTEKLKDRGRKSLQYKKRNEKPSCQFEFREKRDLEEKIMQETQLFFVVLIVLLSNRHFVFNPLSIPHSFVN